MLTIAIIALVLMGGVGAAAFFIPGVGAVLAAFFGGIWSRFQVYLLAAGAVLVALIVAWFKGRASGKAVVVEEQKQERADAVVQRKETDEKVDALPSTDLDKQLDPWMRD